MQPHDNQDEAMSHWEKDSKLIENIKQRDLQEGEPYTITDPVEKKEKLQEL